MDETNIIYIGQKPIMNYVLAVMKKLNGGGSTVVIKARGKSISKAVDVALIARDRFIDDGELDGIKIKTETLSGEDGISLNVSSIEIAIHKP